MTREEGVQRPASDISVPLRQLSGVPSMMADMCSVAGNIGLARGGGRALGVQDRGRPNGVGALHGVDGREPGSTDLSTMEHLLTPTEVPAGRGVLLFRGVPTGRGVPARRGVPTGKGVGVAVQGVPVTPLW